MNVSPLSILPIPCEHEFTTGDRIATLLEQSARAHGTPIIDGDAIVVTQKIVSKAEGRVVSTHGTSKAALISSEARRILRVREEMMITETRHGFVCANAGIDFSNMPDGTAALLPLNADRSAQRIRDEFAAVSGIAVGVVISDTFGRPWRRGLTDVAIGAAGIAAIIDLRGTTDMQGRRLEVTEIAVIDEIAGAAELVMGKTAGIPAAIVRGLPTQWLQQDGRIERDIVRPADQDLFR